MLKIIDELRTGKALLNLIRDPQRTDEIFKISEIALSRPGNAPMTQAIVDRAMMQEGFRDLLAKKYLAPRADLGKLFAMDASTLGHAYAAHMKANGLDPEFFPRFAIDEPMRFFAIRTRESHDIWHVLAGYDTSVKGELALQGFTLAQTGAALPGLLLATGLIHVAKTEPTRVEEYFAAMVEGYERGKAAKHLLSIPFEELWDMPLERAREMASIAPLGQAG